MSHGFGWLIGAVLVTGGGASMWWITQARSDVAPEGRMPVVDGAADPAEPPKKTEFATGGDAGGEAAGVKFDSDRALKYLKQLCDIGPRISATDGMTKQQELLEKHFKDLGATVTRQQFKAKQRSRKNAVDMANLIVTWHPDKARRVVLTTHYDTRPIADQEALPGNWNKPFVSANDGTSGVAMLMELGHHMKDLKTEFGVDFVFFDGEEYVFETTATGGGDKYFFGSEFFADDYVKTKDKRKFRYDAGLLFDLCAGKNAELKVEQNSYTMAQKLVDQVWGIAKGLGAKSFKYEAGHEVLDDHIALNRAGIPTADIIDFDYAHWHKLSDTPDKISGEQMAEVAKVVTVWLQKIK